MYGIRAKVKVAKNKVAPPFRIAEFDILFGQGISTVGCLVDMAEETNIIVRKGAWYSFEGSNIGQSRDNTIQYFADNPEFAESVEQQVRQRLELGAAVSANSITAVEAEEAA